MLSQISNFRVTSEEEVSGETPGMPLRHVWGCDRGKLFIRKKVDEEAEEDEEEDEEDGEKEQ
eukprot:9141769-Pyramimonas_sp.AAC.1